MVLVCGATAEITVCGDGALMNEINALVKDYPEFPSSFCQARTQKALTMNQV